MELEFINNWSTRQNTLATVVCLYYVYLLNKMAVAEAEGNAVQHLHRLAHDQWRR